MRKKVRRVGVLTGGGDAPGLNSVLEGFVRRAVTGFGWEVVGSEDGFEGLIQPPENNKVVPLHADRVAGIAPKG
jgi:6-phosphofructokinase